VRKPPESLSALRCVSLRGTRPYDMLRSWLRAAVITAILVIAMARPAPAPAVRGQERCLELRGGRKKTAGLKDLPPMATKKRTATSEQKDDEVKPDTEDAALSDDAANGPESDEGGDPTTEVETEAIPKARSSRRRRGKAVHLSDIAQDDGRNEYFAGGQDEQGGGSATVLLYPDEEPAEKANETKIEEPPKSRMSGSGRKL